MTPAVTTYRGTAGQRPYAGAGWYYAEYRDRVSPEFITLLAERLGWRRTDRVLDLGAGPGQLSILVAPLVTEVVAIEPEPDMLTEVQRRVQAVALDNVTFVAALLKLCRRCARRLAASGRHSWASRFTGWSTGTACSRT